MPIPKIMIVMPDILLIFCNVAGEIDSPKSSVMPPIKNHQSDDPRKTPITGGMNEVKLVVSYLIPNTANTATKEKISKGLASVRKKVEKNACAKSRDQVATGRIGFAKRILMPRPHKKRLLNTRIRTVCSIKKEETNERPISATEE